MFSIRHVDRIHVCQALKSIPDPLTASRQADTGIGEHHYDIAAQRCL